MKKTAIIIGATGLVGSSLVKELVDHRDYEEIRILHRRTTGVKHDKIDEHIIDFDTPSTYQELVKGDVLFSSLGTTIKKAGSQDAQYKIDFQYQYDLAKAASENGVKSYVLISSSGANAKSSIFYSRIKGELEEAVKKLNFEKIVILQPSVLDGDRKEVRFGESVGIVLGKLLSWIPGIRKYRPIHSTIVAKAMINALELSSEGIHTYQREELFELAT